MIDTLLLRPSLHFTQLHFTPLHCTCRHFTSHLNFTQQHFTTLSFGYHLVGPLLCGKAFLCDLPSAVIIGASDLYESKSRMVKMVCAAATSLYPLHVLTKVFIFGGTD